MKMPEPLLSPSEIATTIYDSGHVRDKGSAHRLEQRIVAYGAAMGTEAHTKALVQAARKAHSTLAGIKGANNRAAAARVVRAIESLLPNDPQFVKGYGVGYSDCAEDKPNRAKRDDATPSKR